MTTWTRNSKTLFKLFRSIKFIYFTLLSYHVYIFVSLNRPPSRNVFWIDKKRLTNCWCRITLNCINNVFLLLWFIFWIFRGLSYFKEMQWLICYMEHLLFVRLKWFLKKVVINLPHLMSYTEWKNTVVQPRSGFQDYSKVLQSYISQKFKCLYGLVFKDLYMLGQYTLTKRAHDAVFPNTSHVFGII